MNKSRMSPFFLALELVLLFPASLALTQAQAPQNASFERTKTLELGATAKEGVEISDAVFHITAVYTDTTSPDALNLQWTPASASSLFRYDDGNLVDGVSLTNAGPRGILGNSFPAVRSLERINWALYGDTIRNRKVNILVFGLDTEGTPVLPVLYSASVECQSRVLCNHNMPYPLQTPNGCLIAFSSADDRTLSLGLDDGGNSTWPFQRGVSWSNTDYLSSSFVAADRQGLDCGLMVRCHGKKADAAQEIPGHYRIWRFEAGQEETPKNWSLISDTYLETNTYADAAFPQLAPNVYYYAVDTACAENESLPTLSYPVYKDMFTSVQLTLKTISSTIVPEGASVSLEGLEGPVQLPVYTQLADAEGKVAFASVLKGVYKLSIEWAGFKPIEQEIDLSQENAYDLGSFNLEEYIEQAYGLAAGKTKVPQVRHLSWNPVQTLVEDVEGHEDFAINSPGPEGWSYIDGDGGTPYGINNCTFPNSGKPLAFMVFNPGRTTPVLSNLPQAIPHGGEKYFAAFANMPASSSSPAPANNDFLISPAMDMESDFAFSFYAKSYDNQYPEQFRVWYSTNGKELQDFTHELTNGPVTAPDSWTCYTYAVPQEAVYVAINYVSQDQFIFMVDDLSFTENPSQAVPLGFEVTVDGNVLDTVEVTGMETGILSQGPHTAEVTALFRTGNAGKTTLQFEVEDYPVALKAQVVNPEQQALAGVQVNLNGAFTYQTTSDAEGDILIAPVQGMETYTLELQAEDYKTFSQEIRFEQDTLDLGTLVLQDQPTPPGALFVEADGQGRYAELSWRAPSDYKLFRKDDGRIEGGLGSNSGTEKTVVGAVHEETATLYQISWMTATQGTNQINLFVFDLDENGMPVKQILYEQHGIDNIGLQWNTYYLEEPLECPNGFMLGVSGTGLGNVGLGADSGRDSIWPFIPRTNYLISDYTDTEMEFSLLDQQFTRNLMIRAEGSTEAFMAKSATKAVSGYKVYRSMPATGESPARWTCLTPQAITGTSYQDDQWIKLDKGYYHYAVRSVYANGDSSEMAYSNLIGKDMETQAVVEVHDAANQPLADAKVSLSLASGESFEALSDAGGKASFENIPTGIYTLGITKDGMADFLLYDLDFSLSSTYSVGPYCLGDPIPAPTGLQVEEGTAPGNRIARWQAAGSSKETTVAGKTASLADYIPLGKQTKDGLLIYQLYLDGERCGQTAETFFLLSGLQTGRHTLGIRARQGNLYSPLSEVEFKVEDVANEAAGLAGMQIWPNPVPGKNFHVRCPEPIQRIRLMDAGGRYEEVSFDAGGTAVEAWTSAPAGFYLIEVQTEAGVYRSKIILR